MERLFSVNDLTGKELSIFKVSLDKRGGFEYSLLKGEEPCWQDVIRASTYLFTRTKLSDGERSSVSDKEFSFREDDSDIDIRFTPAIVEVKSGVTEKLPVTIDDQAILEKRVHMSFDMALKVALAGAMVVGPKHFLRTDHKKILKLQLSKFNVTTLGNKVC